jgi:hypothetical protein
MKPGAPSLFFYAGSIRFESAIVALTIASKRGMITSIEFVFYSFRLLDPLSQGPALCDRLR